jgi:hypothetical protein
MPLARKSLLARRGDLEMWPSDTPPWTGGVDLEIEIFLGLGFSECYYPDTKVINNPIKSGGKWVKVEKNSYFSH